MFDNNKECTLVNTIITKGNDDLSSALINGVSKSETTRRAYADIDEDVPMDKLFLKEDKNINESVLQDEVIDEINEELREQFKEQMKEEDKQRDKEEYKQDINKLIEKFHFAREEEKWLYACNDIGADGTVYNIDKSGNLISKIDVNTLWRKVGVKEGKIELTENDKEHLLNIINEVRKQINFINEQETLKDEIKGYPEYNEAITKIYKLEDIIPRFKTEKNMLRAMLSSSELNDLRLLLSIVETKNVDYFNQLISDQVVGSDYFPIHSQNTKKVFDGMVRWINIYRKFPSIKTLVMYIGLPYSVEFFSEYLYEESLIDTIIEQRYSKLRDAYCRSISEYLRENSCVSEELIQTLTQLDYMIIPPSSDTSFDNLRETIENRKEDINLSTGIEILDEEKAFIKKGKISTVFAYTGSFKTMFCSNTAYNVMKNDGNVLYLSLEINKAEMYMNFLSRYSYEYDKKISHSDIKNSTLDYEDKEYLFNTIYPNFSESLKPHLIIFDETDITSNTYATFSKLLLQADNSFTKRTGHGIDLVIVDHLNLLKFDSGEKAFNDYSAVNHWMSYFRKNAVNFLEQKREIAILCACQSSREGYKSALKNGRYDLTGIAEGNEIERSSQLVLSIFTKDTDRELNQTRMQILKSRDNAPTTDTLFVGLKPEYYTFGLKVEQPETETDDEEENYDNDTNIIEMFGY